VSVVGAGKVVGFDFVLYDTKGVELERSTEPMYYLHGARGIVPGLEEALEGKGVGDQVDVTVPPEKAYGPKRNVKPQEIMRSRFPADADVKKGARFVANGPDGKPMAIWVTRVIGKTILVSPEHPLAGQTLRFEATVRAIRDATDEEKAHGHAHGPEGHAHEHG
jgi:FKBP-type peptidyl-prolyl cis-trans isomerase SlyD